MTAISAIRDPRTGLCVPSGRDVCVSRFDPRWGTPGEICGKPADQIIAGIALCRLHASKLDIWRHQETAREQDLIRQQEARARAAWALEMESWAASGPQVVYYILRPDRLIKIGTTVNLDQRLAALRQEHGRYLRVLLTHCGDHRREHRMHEQFADLRVTGEWFRPEEPLISWILKVRGRHLNVRTLLPGTEPVSVVKHLAAQRA